MYICLEPQPPQRAIVHMPNGRENTIDLTVRYAIKKNEPSNVFPLGNSSVLSIATLLIVVVTRLSQGQG